MWNEFQSPNWESSSYDKFKDITIREVFEWMAETSRFFASLYTPQDIEHLREMKLRGRTNVRRTE